MLVWNSATEQQRVEALQRPANKVSDSLLVQTNAIIERVQKDGDVALLELTRQFDSELTKSIRVSEQELARSEQLIDDELKEAIKQAYKNIFNFHVAQKPKTIQLNTQPGVQCGLRYEPIKAVGIYVPGGSAPLPSSVLMQGVLAQIAEVETCVLCTPPQQNGQINPAVLYAARLCGIKYVFAVGGAQAVAAMAIGTHSVPKVSKVFGPGNAYVTMAKQLLAQQIPGFAIDMPAGPSEVLVIADQRANPEFVAADLLSQAEHGADSQVILLTESEALIEQVKQALEQQLKTLSRANTAKGALENSSLILVETIEQAFSVSAEYGPEHLILQIENAHMWLDKVVHAGSVFVGDYTPESAGDYASGTNHVLPTYGYSKVYSSLNLLDFFRTFTVQTISGAGLVELSKSILPMAKEEGLDAHANAVKVRLKALQQGAF